MNRELFRAVKFSLCRISLDTTVQLIVRFNLILISLMVWDERSTKKKKPTLHAQIKTQMILD